MKFPFQMREVNEKIRTNPMDRASPFRLNRFQIMDIMSHEIQGKEKFKKISWIYLT